MRDLEDLLIRAPNGGEIPLNQAAIITQTNAPMRIERVDGARVLNVTANVIPGVNTANKVLAALTRHAFPDILAKYPGLRYSFEGGQREQRESLRELSWGLVAALFAIFAIMASLLRSYVQAIVILLTIPWSLAGAVVGHKLLGFGLMIFETSIQALFLVPMAISLGIGTLVSSLVILIFIPTILIILEDIGPKSFRLQNKPLPSPPPSSRP